MALDDDEPNEEGDDLGDRGDRGETSCSAFEWGVSGGIGAAGTEAGRSTDGGADATIELTTLALEGAAEPGREKAGVTLPGLMGRLAAPPCG